MSIDFLILADPMAAVSSDLKGKEDVEKKRYLRAVFNLREIIEFPADETLPKIWRLVSEDGKCAVFFPDTDAFLQIPASKGESEYFGVLSLQRLTMASPADGVQEKIVMCTLGGVLGPDRTLTEIAEAGVVENGKFVSLEVTYPASLEECSTGAASYFRKTRLTDSCRSRVEGALDAGEDSRRTLH
jgi:hypothetical protein